MCLRLVSHEWSISPIGTTRKRNSILVIAGLLASGAASATPGLLGDYYYRLSAGPVSVAQALAAISGVAPTATFTATAVCFPSCGSSISDAANLSAFFGGNVSNLTGTVPDLTDHVVMLAGFVPIATTGNYTFALGSDDGSRLLIDGQIVVNNDGLHPFAFVSNSVQLTKGYHSISIVQFENGGNTGLTAELNGSPIGSANTTTTNVAEPTSLAVLGLGLGSFGLITRRRRAA